MKKLKKPYRAANPVRLVWLIIFLGFFACLQIAMTGWWTARNMRVAREDLDALNLRLADARSLLEQRLVQQKWEYTRLLATDANEPGQDMEGGKSLKELAREYKTLADDPDLAGLFRILAERIAELDIIHSQCLHWELGFRENRRRLPATHKQILETLGRLEEILDGMVGDRRRARSGMAQKIRETGAGAADRGMDGGEGADPDAATVWKNLAELRLLAEMVYDEEDVSSLLALKDLGLPASLAGLHKALSGLQAGNHAAGGVGQTLLAGLEELLLGKGYALEPDRNRIVPGLGGLFNQAADRLQLLAERDRLRKTMLTKLAEVRTALHAAIAGVEGSSKIKALRVEQLLKKGWLTILFVAFAAAAVFLVISIRIISEIRKQIVAIEDANHVLDARTRELLESREELSEAKERLEHLSRSLLSAQEDERRRISRELHDELGQAMAVLKLQVRAAEKTLGAEAPAPLKSECEKIRSHINQIIENVRRLSRDLSPVVLEDLGLEAAVHYLAENFSRFHNVKIDLDLQEIIHLVSEDKQRNVYRILQELLNNVAKHARARHVSIAVRKIKNFLRITVADDGSGFDVHELRKRQAAERGLGLAAMTERVRILGGSLDIVSRPGAGTTVNFTAPI